MPRRLLYPISYERAMLRLPIVIWELLLKQWLERDALSWFAVSRDGSIPSQNLTAQLFRSPR